MVLDVPGVWNDHAVVELASSGSYTISSCSDASVAVDGVPVSVQKLANGSRVQMGSAELEFRIMPARQRALRVVGWMPWIALCGALFWQALLLVWLGL
jgi:hypothetical protein